MALAIHAPVAQQVRNALVAIPPMRELVRPAWWANTRSGRAHSLAGLVLLALKIAPAWAVAVPTWGRVS